MTAEGAGAPGRAAVWGVVVLLFKNMQHAPFVTFRFHMRPALRRVLGNILIALSTILSTLDWIFFEVATVLEIVTVCPFCEIFRW